MASGELTAKDARIAELEQINTSMCMLLAKIREVSGVGAKPMPHELEYAIAGRIRELEAECEDRLMVIQFWEAHDAGNNARIGVLEEALNPFAELAKNFDERHRLHVSANDAIAVDLIARLSHCRRAREVLNKGKQE